MKAPLTLPLLLALGAAGLLPAQTPAGPMDPPLPGEEILATQPKVAALGDFAAPAARIHRLSNGLRVYLVDRPGAPILSLGFVARLGAQADPQGKAGLASLSAAMLQAGSAGRSQAELATEADALGATLSTRAGGEATYANLSALPSRLPQLARLLADVVLRPNLDPKEWDRLKAQRKAELSAQLAQPQTGASLAFLASLYGDGPQGRPTRGTPASVDAARLKDVKAFLARFSPKDSALIVVGAAPERQALPVLEAAFGGWRGGRAPKGAVSAPKATPPAGPPPRLVVVDYPDRPQTVVRVGQPAVPGRAPEALPLQLLNAVLGGSFTSRLNQNLREVHGYTYGAASSFAFGHRPGPFNVQTNVKTQNTGAAVAEVLKELRLAVAEPLPPDDLEKGKALLAFEMVETLQQAEATAARVAEQFVEDLPQDALATMVPRLRALDAATVHKATRKVLDPERMTIVLAGDRKAVLPQLEAAGLALPAPQFRTPLGELLPK